MGKIMRKISRQDRIDSWLSGNNDKAGWRTVYDEVNDEKVKLTPKEVDILTRVSDGKFPHSELDQYGFLARVAEVFKIHEVIVDMIATSEISIAFTTQRGENLDGAISELEEFSKVEVYHDMEQVSVVGEEIRERIGFAEEVFAVLRDLEINIELISFGATRINLSFLVGAGRGGEVVQVLHERLFE